MALQLLLGALIAPALAIPLAGSALEVLERRQLSENNADLSACPGYNAANVQQSGCSITAELSLAGAACNAYGTDIQNLLLTATYDSAERLHVVIEDAGRQAYRVPTSVFTPPESHGVDPEHSHLQFNWVASPFSFTVTRRASGEVLFDSSAAPLVFEDQYLRLRTALPEDPNLYGLGEHNDNLRLNTTDYIRTLWSRDSFGIPPGTNLYGNHPVYFDHRGENGTHGVFLLSSVGMDIKINNTAEDGQYLEYNLLGGVIDLYFMAGNEPTDVSKQYALVAGLPAMNSYWSLGFHQCRYGYRDYYAVAESIYNYSAAGIPLETQWTDIDYMYERWVFTLDPDRFPLARVQDIVNYLHEHDQHYIVMVNPATAVEDYTTYNRGVQQDVFMKYENGTIFQGVVWPGPTAFPDWFHPNTQGWWNQEFLDFFDDENGVDIDGLWNDMNEAANFCPFPCPDPEAYAAANRFPPRRPFVRSQPRVIPGFPPEFQPGASNATPDSLPYNDPNLAPAASVSQPTKLKRQTTEFGEELDTPLGLPGRNLLEPPYRIQNAATEQDYGGLSNKTINTDLRHENGLAELDVHNLYGAMMSETSRDAMLARRPGLRPLVVTRSTFAGAGRYVAKWLGDNLSTWEQYRKQIHGMLEFNALFQVPMVGSDVCGFGSNTTELLCARWAMLGAFNPFYRNHNQDTALPQEFYIWDSVTRAARTAIEIRYKLLDYFYTAMHEQTVDGTPSLNPMFFKYPSDPNTFALEYQFFYGHSLLVSPVTEENATDVEIYLPNDLFYDFYTYEPIQGNGTTLNLTDIGFEEIPLHIKGGSIIPMRTEWGMTTTEVRTKPFDLVIAPSANGTAHGSLYLDDGVSIEQNGTTYITFTYNNGHLNANGTFNYMAEANSISKITVLGTRGVPEWAKSEVISFDVDIPLTKAFTLEW